MPVILVFNSDYDRKSAISSSELRINSQIRAREVRLIDDEEQNIGVVSLQQAIEMAEEAGLDLVEVAPNAKPPVCKIMDYGKFQYQQQKRERNRRKNQKAIQVKEIQLRPKTDDHHLGFKVKDARRWIEEGMKVRIKVKFRGREITHSSIGLERLNRISAELADVAVVEQRPSLEGYNMTMVLAPIPEKK
jgi:translation initiation factor IF-3